MNEIFLKIINMSISAGWLILVVVLLRLLLKKAPKWVSVLLWGIVAVRLLCPISIESAVSLIPSAETIPRDIEVDWTPAIDSGIDAINNVVNPVISASFTPNPAASANPLQIWIPVASILWVAGMAVMLLYTAISYWRLRRRVSTAVLYRDNIYQSENAGSPFVLGIIRPKIYLPFKMDDEDLELVVAHECAHIRRKDHWWKPLGFFLLAIHWFNPLVWLAYILLCRDIELACDEKVIKVLDNAQKADYTQALLVCSIGRKRISACPLAFGEVGVKERVKSVMNYKKPAFWIIIVAIVICVAVAVCFLTDPKQENTAQEVSSDYFTFEAEIKEINDGYFLVEPVPGSTELKCADRIEVPMVNMEPSPEPQVGDILVIQYNGMMQETYPAVIGEVYSIRVRQEEVWDLIPMVMVDGQLYLDTGYKINNIESADGFDGQITSEVDSSRQPTQNDQSNFGMGYGYRYGFTTGTLYIYMNEKWWLYATEEARQELLESVFSEVEREYPRYHLKIGEDGVMNIELTLPSSGGGTQKLDGTEFEKGDWVELRFLDGCKDLRGLEITALDKDGEIVWAASVPDTEENEGFTRLKIDDWEITDDQ